MNLKTVDGWKKLMLYIKYPYKYERVENYVAARQLIQEKIQMLSQLRKSLLASTLNRKNELVKKLEDEKISYKYKSDLDELYNIQEKIDKMVVKFKAEYDKLDRAGRRKMSSLDGDEIRHQVKPQRIS